MRAKILARTSWDEAHRLATEAVAMAERTDFVTVHAEALIDLAEVRLAGERPDEAAEAVEQALACWSARATSPPCARARALIPS